MESKFLIASEEIKKVTQKPSDDDLLKLYAFYKQATVGDNTTDKPGMFDLKGKAKWNAWSDVKGMNKETAQESYINLAKLHLPKAVCDSL